LYHLCGAGAVRRDIPARGNGTLTELRKQAMRCCVSYPRSDLEVETQDEDEVYELNLVDTLARAKSEQFALDEE